MLDKEPTPAQALYEAFGLMIDNHEQRAVLDPVRGALRAMLVPQVNAAVKPFDDAYERQEFLDLAIKLEGIVHPFTAQAARAFADAVDRAVAEEALCAV